MNLVTDMCRLNKRTSWGWAALFIQMNEYHNFCLLKA